MNIVEPALRTEIDRVLGTSNPVYYSWRIELFVDDVVLDVVNLNKIDRLSRYDSAHFDIINVQLQVTPSVYQNQILNNANKLKARLFRDSQNNQGTINISSRIVSEVYEAFLPKVDSPGLATRNAQANGTSVDDSAELFTIDINLVTTDTLTYRSVTTSGCFYDTTMTELLQGLLSHPINGSRLPVTIVTPTNTEDYYQTVIPSATRLFKLPRYLQKQYGIYGSEVNCYIKRNNVFVYPLFDTSRFLKEENTLTIYNVPREAMAGLEKSWVKNGNNLYIIATGDTTLDDKSEHSLYNVGSAIQYAKVGNLIDNFRTYSGEVGTLPETNQVRVDIDNRERRVNHIIHPEGLMTDNPLQEVSKISKGLGSVVQLAWENANEQELFPGMPIKLVYQAKGKVLRLHGTLLGEQSVTNTYQNNTQMDNRFRTTVVLTLWVEREYTIPQ